MLAKSSVMVVLLLVITPGPARAGADIPPECAAVLEALGRKGDFKDDVCRVNIPRADLAVTIAGRPTPTAFGFGGWLALTPGDGEQQVMMGDLVLTEEEVNPVMSALLESGFEVTALHNHFFQETPRIFYMHVHAMGTPAALAARAKPALSLIGRATAGTAASSGASVPPATAATD